MTAPHISAEYFRFRRRLLLVFLTVACLSLLGVGWKIRSSHIERGNTARAQTQALAHALAAHVADAIGLADYAALSFASAFQHLSAEQQQAAPLIRQLLASRAPASGDLRMLFIDAGGRGVATSTGLAPQDASFAQRDYFQAHAANQAGAELYIGEPIKTKLAGRRAITLSRRVLDAQGNFQGVIVALIDAARLDALFERARPGPDISLALLHQDGKLVARAPMAPSWPMRDLSSSPLFRHIRATPGATFEADSPLDGRPTIYSARTLAPHRLHVLVGIPARLLERDLLDDLLFGAMRLLVLVGVMLVSAHFLLDSYRRLERNRQALQESELRWRFALEGAGDGLWDWDIANNAIHFSPRWKQMMGYAEDEIENTPQAWHRLIHPDDRPAEMAQRQAYLNDAGPARASEYRMLCKDGSWKWMLARGMVVSRDGAGQALRAIGTHADIGARKQAEQLQVQRVIEAAPDPMLLIGAAGLIAFANRAAQAAFGYPLSELIGQNIDNLVPLTTRNSLAHLRRQPARAIPAAPGLKLQQGALRKDRAEFPAEISLSPFQMDGQAVVIAHIRDLSDSRRAARMLQQSFTELRRLSDHQEQIKELERKRIAQDIHDDLGQNLLALKMDVTMLHARTATRHPRLHERARIVLENIDGTIRSVKSIMNDLRPALLELGLYPAVKWQLQQFERRSGVSCKLVAPEAEFGLDEGQVLAVFRILQEALANVARHAQASEVRIVLGHDQRGFSMTVSDNGKGLAPGDRCKNNSFGLIGMRERSHTLGGEFSLNSVAGKGTALSVTVPAAPPPA